MLSLIHQLFEERVAAAGDATALISEGHLLSYSELNTRANRLAHQLRIEGVGPDRLVGIYLERGISLVVGLLAILKAGGAYVPLDPTYPADRLAFMIEDAAPCALLTQESLRAQLPPSKARVAVLDADAAAVGAQDPGNLCAEELGLRPQNLAYVIYTSGSTGRPKGVMIEHAAVVNFLLSMQRWPGIGPADRLLAVTTIAFDIAALEIYLPLVSGATAVLADGRKATDSQSLVRLLETQDITMMQATPATWRLLLHGGWKGRPSLKILCGGEALSTQLSQKLLERAASVWNMYGPTETTIWSCARKVTTAARAQHTEPIGDPIDNTTIHILDEHLQPVPGAAIGEIYIGGAGLARGYLNRADLTAERFVKDPFGAESLARMYRTGDLGRRRQDGAIDFLGRTDHQVKIRGYRIELGEIEVQLARHSDVREAAVVARDEEGEKRLVAYLIAQDPAAPPTFEKLRQHLTKVLPEYMVPSAFFALDRFPLTPNGKLDRRALLEAEGGCQLRRNYDPPRGESEEIIAKIWRTLLGAEQIGRHDNFFELGGYSMLALELRSRLQNELGFELSLSALIEAPTVAGLAQLIGAHAPRDSVVLIRAGEGGPPVFLIHDGDGEILLYRNLAMRLDRRHPVFGLNPHALPGVPVAHTRIRDMAAYHIQKIKSVQPHGPYLVGGMCAGGVIAFEMARQLEARGETVALVALLDAADPEAALKPWKLAKERLERMAGELRQSRSVPAVFRGLAIAARFARKLRNFVFYHIGKHTRQMRDRLRVHLLRTWLDLGLRPSKWVGVPAPIVIVHAEHEYRARQPLQAADLVLFRASCGVDIDAPFIDFFADPLLGWGSRSAHGVRVVDVPGGHTSMLQEPHSHALAKTLQEAIDASLSAPERARAASSGRSSS